MKITITFDAVNAAFGDCDETRMAESSRILDVARMKLFDLICRPQDGDEAQLLDVNGNYVGKVHVSRPVDVETEDPMILVAKGRVYVPCVYSGPVKVSIMIHEL